jgi:hypothetical protein
VDGVLVAAQFMANAPLRRKILRVAGEGNVMVYALGAAPVSMDSVRALGLGLGAPCSEVLRSEYPRDVPVQPEDPATAATNAFLFGHSSVTDDNYVGARERLSIDLDYGVELDHYDRIGGFVWRRGDRLAVYVRPDKLPPVVLRLADEEAVRGSGPAAASSPAAGSGQREQSAEVQVL